MPAVNVHAVMGGQRTSPVDGLNLNRTFPGNPRGTITEQISAFMAEQIFPRGNAFVDLHSGGSSLDIIPSAVIEPAEDKALQGARVQVNGIDSGTVGEFVEGQAALRVLPGNNVIRVVDGSRIVFDQQIYLGDGVGRTITTVRAPRPSRRQGRMRRKATSRSTPGSGTRSARCMSPRARSRRQSTKRLGLAHSHCWSILAPERGACSSCSRRAPRVRWASISAATCWLTRA